MMFGRGCSRRSGFSRIGRRDDECLLGRFSSVLLYDRRVLVPHRLLSEGRIVDGMPTL